MAEHKRRARWRLLGALILTGAVAAIAPVLLEDQARPLSQDLLIEIPSKNSVFSKIESLKPAAPATEPSSAVEPKVEAKAESKAEPKAEPKAALKAEPKSETKSATKAEPKTEPKAAPKAEPKTEPKAAPKAEPKKEVVKDSGKGQFLVQVGAYARLESANAVRAKLVSGGHTVQIQTITLDDGSERHRVRIGPFESRDQAVAVRDRAKSQGYDAVVVTP